MSKEAQKSHAAAAAAAPAETVIEKSILDQIVDEGRLARDPESRTRSKDLVKQFVAQFLEGSMTLSRDSEAMINSRIAQIDHLISLQLNEVMHHPTFQKLESSCAMRELIIASESRDRVMDPSRN